MLGKMVQGGDSGSRQLLSSCLATALGLPDALQCRLQKEQALARFCLVKLNRCSHDRFRGYSMD